MISSLFAYWYFKMLVYIFSFGYFCLSGKPFIDLQVRLQPDIAINDVSCQFDSFTKRLFFFGYIRYHTYTFLMFFVFSYQNNNVVYIVDVVFFETEELFWFLTEVASHLL